MIYKVLPIYKEWFTRQFSFPSDVLQSTHLRLTIKWVTCKEEKHPARCERHGNYGTPITPKCFDFHGRTTLTLNYPTAKITCIRHELSNCENHRRLPWWWWAWLSFAILSAYIGSFIISSISLSRTACVMLSSMLFLTCRSTSHSGFLQSKKKGTWIGIQAYLYICIPSVWSCLVHSDSHVLPAHLIWIPWALYNLSRVIQGIFPTCITLDLRLQIKERTQKVKQE